MSRHPRPLPLLALLPLLAAAAPPASDAGLVAGRPLEAWVADLDDKDTLVREEAVEVLGGLGKRAAAALPKVRGLMTSKSPDVRVRAALAVWEISGDAKEAAAVMAETAEAAPLVRSRVLQAVVRMGPSAAPLGRVLLGMLDDPDQQLRNQAVSALSQLNLAGAEMTLAALKDAPPRVRRNAASHLATNQYYMLGAARIPALMPYVDDADPAVRSNILRVVYQLGGRDEKVVKAVAEVIRTDATRRAMFLAIVPASPEAVKPLVPALEQVLAQPETANRLTAAKLLFALDRKPARLLAACKDVLEGTNRAFWDQAILAAGELGVEAKPLLPRLIAILKTPDYYGYSLRTTLPRIGPDAIPPLVEYLKETKAVAGGYNYPQESAIAALAALGEPAVKAVLPLLDDKDAGVRGRAVRVLGSAGRFAEPAVPKLIELTKDADTMTVSMTLTVLGQVGPAAKAALPRLLEMSKEGAPQATRGRALMALAQIGPDSKDVVEVAEAAVKSTDAFARQQGIELLIRVKPDNPLVLKTVTAMLDAPNTRYQGLSMLQRLGPAAKPAVAEVIKCLDDPQQYTRLQAAVVLGNIGADAKAAGPKIVALLTGPDTGARWQIIPLLRKIGVEAKDAVPALVKILEDRSPGSDYYAGVTVSALGDYGPAASAAYPQVLKAVTSAQSLSYRVQAAQALARIDKARALKENRDDVVALTKANPNDNSTFLAARVLLELDAEDKDGHAVFEKALSPTPGNLRAVGNYYLAQMGPAAKRYLPKIRDALKDPQAYTRQNAALAVWKITGDPKEALPVFEALLKDANQSVRTNAVYILNELGTDGKAALPALKAALATETDANAKYQLEVVIRKLSGLPPAPPMPPVYPTPGPGRK